MPEFIHIRRSNHSLLPVITDREGALGADVTFPGFLVIYLDRTVPRPTEDDLLAALVALRGRHSGIKTMLHRWDARDDERRLLGYLERTEVRVIYLGALVLWRDA